MDPPHDSLHTNSAQLEVCDASNTTIHYLRLCEQNNKKICECHAVGRDLRSVLAAYLIAAYDGSYFGFGDWQSTEEYSVAWKNQIWPSWFNTPLGRPVSDGAYAGGLWTRSFEHARVNFNPTNHSGEVIFLD